MESERTGIVNGGRVNRLREKVLKAPEICIERGYWMTQSYKETEGQPMIIRRARALQKILKEMTIGIDKDELIVGRATSKERGGPLVPEVQWNWALEEMETISTREWDRFGPLSVEEKSKMNEFLPYWKGISLYDKYHAIIPENLLKLKNMTGLPTCCCLNTTHTGHVCPDYDRIVNKGLIDVKHQVEVELGKLNLACISDFQKYQFLTAVNITLGAAIDFANRYSQLAQSLADQETDLERKRELEAIAELCGRVPANPARNFYEALQSVWLVHVVLNIEGWGPGVNFGRSDQYLYPLYKKDIADGLITREQARTLIDLFYVKMNGLINPLASETVKTLAGFPVHANVTLGGITKEGRDAVNDLSFLFLEADEDVRLTAEDFIIRVHKNTPEAFLIKACEVARLLRGKLKFLSDETTIQQLMSDGKPVELARDYIIGGCYIPTIGGKSWDMPGDMLNLPLMLELALNNGVSRLNGEQLGPQTGDPRLFKSYQEVWEAYTKQVETHLPVRILFKNTDKNLFAEFAQTPFQSALYHGCIEKGLDITNGGTAPYLSHYTSLSGAPDVGDALAAIKKLVFEDKKITMERLIKALDKNFQGEEEVLFLLKRAPKFGNDDDYVDTIVNDVLTHGSQTAAKYKGIAGAVSNVCAGIATGNIPMGYRVGASPDGRKAGEPLSEGGISPHQGRNINGPTATMRSVAKLDHIKITGGSVLNMRFNPEVLKGEANLRKFVSLIRTFCETGGALVQFNIIDAATLRDAQNQPEKYRDLLVRVATYSAYFVELSPELQNDIIARMQFEEV